MFEYPASPWLVPATHDFQIAHSPTLPTDDVLQAKNWKKQLKKQVKKLAALQEKLYADNRYSVLLVFQAMDAAGKDSTIRSVLSGVNPAGCQVYAFKQPSKEELDHDFLWRSAKCLPERGRIGVFNRSYYEETLVVRVHPEYLTGQRLPAYTSEDELWSQRFNSIVEHEKHLVNNGTIVLKFWLNVSQTEQHERFKARLVRPEKNWKFSAGDLAESALWPHYMQAYEQMLNATSTAAAPWYAIPADNKNYMRYAVASTIVQTLETLDLQYPALTAKNQSEMHSCAEQLGVTIPA